MRLVLASSLEHERDVAIGRKADGVVVDGGNKSAIDKMVVSFVAALSLILFGQLDAVTFYPIDGADMHAVSANDFCMFFNCDRSAMVFLLCMGKA